MLLLTALTTPSPIPTTSSGVPISPIEFASYSRNSLEPPSPLTRTRSLDTPSPQTNRGDDEVGLEPDALSQTRDRKVSSASISSYLPMEKTPEQVQRARAARITRHLGDDVPPEILFRAASPPPPRHSPSPQFTSPSPPPGSPAEPMSAPPVPPMPHDLPGGTLHRPLPRRSASLRRKRPNEGIHRRLSLDMKVMPASSLHSSPSMSATVAARPSTAGGEKEGRMIRKSKSMWVRKVHSGEEAHTIELPRKTSVSSTRESFDVVASPAGNAPMTEKERIMNVKRAKKMTQVRCSLFLPVFFSFTKRVRSEYSISVTSPQRLSSRSPISHTTCLRIALNIACAVTRSPQSFLSPAP